MILVSTDNLYSAALIFSSASETRTTLTRQIYPSGTLLIEETVDEEGHTTMVFKDVRGLTVMMREGSSGDWLDTRYVYDDYGDLRWVIQPKQTQSSVQKNKCFRYSYDERGRCTFKALPECEGTSYYYDSRNRLSSANVTRDGADYEGRTGLAATDGTVTGFDYDANGNLTKDPTRDIVLIKYNHLNLPTDVYFGNGQRQTIGYLGNGAKHSVSYSQTSASIVGGNVPADDRYSVTSTRTYVGPHVFEDGNLEYSAFDGGYFDPEGGTMYYLTDWQGNNVEVLNAKCKTQQTAYYYPYGEPTIEPSGQRFLYGGKEREHAGGRNSYDFSARCLISPLAQWGVPDRKAEKYYPLSVYSYCGGDPINYIDPTGNVIIFINGMHTGDGGKPEYWGGIDSQIKTDFNDEKALYYDGSLGGKNGLTDNLNPAIRHAYGYNVGMQDAPNIISNLEEGETIKFVTHSMGASYAKGFIAGMKSYGKVNDIDISSKIEFEVDFAPFQPKGQRAADGINTITIQHFCDGIALPVDMPNADNHVTHENVHPTIISVFSEHSITSFIDDLKKIWEFLNTQNR